jgi:hypothetical protein
MRRILLVLAMLSFGFGVHAPARAEGGQTPVYKRCVGDPPRQTEDPMSLPCDGSFDEDNGGNTYQGVTADEITVLIYVDYGCPNFECGRSPGTYIDLDGTPQQSCPKTWPAGNPDAANCDDILVRTARAYNIWGNDRYQTFARHVHYYMYYSAAGTPESRRADAADNWARLHPFAVIDEAFYGGHNDAYDDAMAARGTMVFGSQYPVPNALETKNAPMQWSFWPDVEHWADLYGGYVCATLAGRPASHAGDATANGGPRSFALWSTSDASKPGLRLFALLVKEKLHQCGADVVAEATYPSEGFDLEGRGVLDVSAVFAVATFETARATTVLWLGGVEGRFTPTAAMLGYHPEIVVAGDLRNDDNASGRLQSQDVWRHAWGVHLQLAMANIEDDYGYRRLHGGRPPTRRRALGHTAVPRPLHAVPGDPSRHLEPQPGQRGRRVAGGAAHLERGSERRVVLLRSGRLQLRQGRERDVVGPGGHRGRPSGPRVLEARSRRCAIPRRPVAERGRRLRRRGRSVHVIRGPRRHPRVSVSVSPHRT